MKILAHGLIAAIGILAAIATSANAQIRCGWTRTVYNDGEPVNAIRFEGNPFGENNRYCEPDTLNFTGVWNDGAMAAYISPRGGNTFSWEIHDAAGSKEGIAYNWAEAMSNLPGYLSNPDHFEDHSDWVD